MCAIRPHTNTHGESHANPHTDSVRGEMCAYTKAASYAGAAPVNSGPCVSLCLVASRVPNSSTSFGTTSDVGYFRSATIKFASL